MSGTPSELTIGVQEAMLREAMNHAELRDFVPPVVALSFGVLPLAQRNDVLYLACRPDVAPDSLTVLRDLVPVPIEGLSFDRDVMLRYLRELNRRMGGVNLPTFRTPDFLREPDALPVLREEKCEQGVNPECTVPDGQIVLLEYEYRSELANLDATDAPVQHYAGDMDITFRARNGRFTVYREAAQKPEAVLVTRRQFALRGIENAWGIGGVVVTRDELPYVVHPTEVQLRGLHEDRLVFHVYDRDVTVPIGADAPQSFECEYFFLDGGQRSRRELTVTVTGTWCVPRASLVYREHEEFGDDIDLDTWFRLD